MRATPTAWSRELPAAAPTFLRLRSRPVSTRCTARSAVSHRTAVGAASSRPRHRQQITASAPCPAQQHGFRPAFRRSTSARRPSPTAASPTWPFALAAPASSADAQRRGAGRRYGRPATTGRCSPTISSTSPTAQADLGARYTHEKKTLQADLQRQQHPLHGVFAHRLPAAAALRDPERTRRHFDDRRQQIRRISCPVRRC